MLPNPATLNLIQSALSDTEQQLSCRVHFACESGSRAWGFASPDSDWDVRYLYSMPIEWYLTVLDLPDHHSQDLPPDLDLSGWELRKALRLFATCNLALNEWLGSPSVYRDDGFLRETLTALIPAFFNPRKAIHHYRSMAMNGLDSLDGSGSISIKKLFYILRPILAATWVLHKRTMPPTSFHELRRVGLAPETVEVEIEEWISQKEVAVEGARITLSSNLLRWIQSSRELLESEADNAPVAPESRPHGDLDGLIRRIVLGA